MNNLGINPDICIKMIIKRFLRKVKIIYENCNCRITQNKSFAKSYNDLRNQATVTFHAK